METKLFLYRLLLEDKESHMIKRLVPYFLSIFILGCTSASPQVQEITKTDLKFKKILILPLTDSDEATKVDEAIKTTGEKAFIDELKTFSDLSVISVADTGQNIWTDLGIENPSKYSVIDFSVSPQGYDRRKKIQDQWGAKAIVLSSIMKKNHTLAMYVQMIDAEDGELTLSFSKIEEYRSSEGEVIEKLAKICADKVISHIKDNVVITNIKRY
jgi:hypothetical protein